MPWFEVDKDNTIELRRAIKMITDSGDWYQAIEDRAGLKRILNQGGRLFVFKNPNHEMALCFQRKSRGVYKIARFAYEGDKPALAAKIAALKVEEFLDEKKVTDVYANVPMHKFASDNSTFKVYEKFKEVGWDVELPDFDGVDEKWVVRKGKRKPD